MASYATVGDFEIHGLPRRLLLPRIHAVLSVDAGADALLMTAPPGWGGTERLQISVAPLSAETPAIPGGLSTSARYYPILVDGSDTVFKLSLTEGGAAVAITDAGSGALALTQQISPMIEAALAMASGLVDDASIAHGSPLVAPYPPAVVWVVCTLAAFDLAVKQGLVVPSYWEAISQTLATQHEAAQKRLSDARSGLAWVGTDSTPDVEENGGVLLEPLDGLEGNGWFGSACRAGVI